MFSFEEIKILPFSGGRYKLNKFGEILDINNNIIETKIIDNRKLINLAWVDGLIDYEVGQVIAITFYNIQLPTHFWNRIIPIYKDGNNFNTNISNICYCFKNGPIEVQEFPGYFYIPFHTSYGISLDGNLLNIKRGKLNSWLITKYQVNKNIKGGYRVARGIRDIGNYGQISRHRAIGLVFLKYETDPSCLVINHKDGIPGNDYPDNLEWVTRAVNNQHAIDNGLMPNSTIKVLMKNLNTGIIEKFNSIAECGRKIGRSESFVNVRMTKTQNYKYYDNLVFKVDDGSEWPVLEDKIKSETGNYTIVARNIFTGSLIIFDNIKDAAEQTNICFQSVFDNINDERIEPINGFNFRYLSSNISWPNHSEKHLKIYKCFPLRPSTGIVVKNNNGEEINFIESIILAAEKYNTSVSTIIRSCKSNKPFQNNFFSFYKLTENLGPPIE